jgi:P-type Ca2+ transporter type 2C
VTDVDVTATERTEQPVTGLSSEDARRRLAEQGPNKIAEATGPSLVRRFLANFVQPLALLLWAAAGPAGG